MTEFNMRKIFILFYLSVSLSFGAASAQDLGKILEVEWIDLLSPADLDAILNPPELTHEGTGWQEQLQGNDEDSAYLNALQSVEVNPDLLGQRIMIPGFIVPLAFDKDRRVTEFFLVPFFGACIHLPPPPPNQIVYVSYERGVQLNNFYDAYVVHGVLNNEVIRNDTATSAYQLQADGVSPYSY